MPVEDGEAVPRIDSHWPSRPTLARRRPTAASFHTYLLDADDDLADEFDIRMRVAARQLTTVRVLEAEIGECDLEPAFDAIAPGPGLLILDGLVAFETCVADRTATELVGAGDLIQPTARSADALLRPAGVWRVLWLTRLALLDAEFADRIRPWPQVVQALLRRAGKRIADVDAMRAITSHPRLEVRLVLVLWHLAARWGRVEPGGIRLTLPLTHRLLGQLVAAERPSISHALGRLSHAGLISGSAGDWHLHGTLDTHLQTLLERQPERTGEQARRIADRRDGLAPSRGAERSTRRRIG
ncbi:MAG: helix-turn-helix domain-containing protein [Trebonia sp.]